MARRLKYSTPETDFESLQQELAGTPAGDSYRDSDDHYGGRWDED